MGVFAREVSCGKADESSQCHALHHLPLDLSIPYSNEDMKSQPQDYDNGYKTAVYCRVGILAAI